MEKQINQDKLITNIFKNFIKCDFEDDFKKKDEDGEEKKEKEQEQEQKQENSNRFYHIKTHKHANLDDKINSFQKQEFFSKQDYEKITLGIFGFYPQNVENENSLDFLSYDDNEDCKFFEKEKILSYTKTEKKIL